MTTDLIRYDLMVQEALKSVVLRVLTDAARDGLPGEHHFYVSFRTDKPGVRISQRLRERYPKDMTIVLQHQFDALTVQDHAFEVGLSFSGVAERLRVPFSALTGFFDPSVQFGLKFDGQDQEEMILEPETKQKGASLPALVVPVPKSGSRKPEVVRPDAGRPDPVRDGHEAPAKKAASRKTKTPDAAASPEASAEVVSLDAFRKKN